MKKWSIIALSILLFPACSEEEEGRKKPNYIVPADSMSEILAELHILNARHQHRDIRKEKLQAYVIQDYQAFYDSILVSQERYDSSFAWWSEEPEVMQQILDKSLNILNIEVSQLKTEKRMKSVNRDTLKQK
jgi:hypothetical protein